MAKFCQIKVSQIQISHVFLLLTHIRLDYHIMSVSHFVVLGSLLDLHH